MRVSRSVRNGNVVALLLDLEAEYAVGGADEGVEIVVLIFRANVARDKAPHLGTLIERLQVAELLLRLSKDKRLISISQYAKAIELTNSVGKQAGGWRRSALSPAS